MSSDGIAPEWRHRRLFGRKKLTHERLISSKFCEQILDTKIPNTQKATFGTWARKSCLLNVDDVDTWAQFHQRSMYSFCAGRSRKRKKILMN